MKQRDIEKFIERLPALQLLLQDKGMDCGPDTWVAVHDLLLVLARKGRLPQDPQGLVPFIGPIVCYTPEQQRAFPALYQAWWTEESLAQRADIVGASQQARQNQLRAADAVERTWGRLPYVLMVLIALVLTGGLWWQVRQEKPEPAPVTSVAVKTPLPETSGTAVNDKAPVIPIDDWAPPRRLGEWPVLPRAWEQPLTVAGKVLPWLPALPALAWLAAYYRRRWVLSRAKAKDGDRDSDFGILLPQPLFGDTAATRQLGRLNRSRWQATSRLDINATVAATARQAGNFTPYYQSRRVRPAYVVLVRSRHSRDQNAALAEELVERIRELGADVESFRFRDDPRQLIPWSKPGANILSLQQLADRSPTARLIVVSEGDILYHPISGRPRPWLEQMAAWEQPAWLHPGPLPEILSRWLWERDILALPLASASLSMLVQWLAAEGDAARKPASYQDPAAHHPPPQTLTLMPERWLDPLPPYDEDLQGLYQQLQAYLGDDGWLLLQAIAVYPEPRWPMTQALDFCLFEQQHPEEREQRFRRLGFLPWIRQGYLPDYLREDLLERLGPAQRRQLRAAYARLLVPSRQAKGPGVLRLDIAAPSRCSVRRAVLDGLWNKPALSSLNDPIFLNLVLGGRLSLLDFHLPRALAKSLPGARWRLNPWPALGILLVAGAAGWGVDALWTRWGEAGVTQARAVIQQWQNRGVAVELSATPEAQVLALGLQQVLEAAGYPVVVGKTPGENVETAIYYAEAADGGLVEHVAERVDSYLRHAAYGMQAKPTVAKGGMRTSLQVVIGQTYQQGAEFRDRLLNPYSPEPDVQAASSNPPIRIQSPKQRSRAAFSVFRDRILQDKKTSAAQNGKAAVAIQETDGGAAWGPEMVVIPAGEFLMGSPAGEKNRVEDEGPQHPVTIRQAFAIGRYEVTFAQYQAYVDAVQASNAKPLPDCSVPKSPDDQGWGKGQHPVINVSHADAQCYASWLAAETGLPYRLPSEAEWEYAARGGSRQAFFWGDAEDAMTKYAWYYQNADMQTHPTGRKRPNAFGLYDTSGNVWEWTQDCWHDSFANAPTDGSAWLEQDKGACVRRVVRGGAWNIIPQLLRSAYRGRITAEVANNDLGFRLARAL